MATVLALVLAGVVAARVVRADGGTGAEGLVGAWRGRVQFTSGAFASVNDLQFLYVFNAGGTMNETSNYDGSPPVAPAYGVWRKVGERTYEAKYEYFLSRPPKGIDDLTSGGGWAPGGRGILLEKMTLAADGRSYKATIRYDAFDTAGEATEIGSTAQVRAERVQF